MPAPLVVFAAEAAAEKHIGLPQLNPEHFAPQLFWLAVSFVLLLVLLSRYALPRVSEVLEARRDRIARDLREAERLKRETEAALAAYEQALAEARGRASALAKQHRETLAAEIDRERARVEAQIAEKLQQSDAQIAETKARALASVEEIAADAAGAIVETLLGTGASPDEVRKALRAPVPAE